MGQKVDGSLPQGRPEYGRAPQEREHCRGVRKGARLAPKGLGPKVPAGMKAVHRKGVQLPVRPRDGW